MNKRKTLFVLSFCLTATFIWGQDWQPLGTNHLETDASTQGVVIGDVSTAPSPNWALTIDGSASSINTGNLLKSISSGAGQWSLFRSTNELGRIYHGSGGGAFTVRQTLANGSLFLRNASGEGNGFRLIDDLNFTLNGYTGNARIGSVAIGDLSVINGASPDMPWSKLHLVHGSGTVSYGWRPWMANGVLFNGNGDQMYMGHKYGGSDVSHAVISWSEDGTLNNDRQTMRFIYTTTPATGTGAVTTDGLEIMRLWPESNTSGFVGIGDFATAAQNPLDRLDVLDGNVRVRALPGTASTTDTKVVVVDANGVLHWRPDSGLGAPGCQWNMNPTSPNHVWTAIGAASGTCPDVNEAVGIGVDLNAVGPNGKLDVRTTNYQTAISAQNTGSTTTVKGLDIAASGGTATNYAVDIVASQTSTGANYGVNVDAVGTSSTGTNYGANLKVRDGTTNLGVNVYVDGATVAVTNVGVRAEVVGGASTGAIGATAVFAKASMNQDGTETHGVYGQAVSSHTGATNYGVRAYAAGGGINYGLWGEAPAATNSWAGYFFGNVKIDGDLVVTGTYPVSDAQFKTNVETLGSATELLQALQPHKFTFTNEAQQWLHLPAGQQIGFIAQEVEQVLPTMVIETTAPQILDSLGAEVRPALAYKGVNYAGMVPILVGALQEQNAVVAGIQQQVADVQATNELVTSLQEQLVSIQEQMAAMQEQLAACCASGGMAPQGGGAGSDVRSSAEVETLMGNARNLRITPNPFAERATLTYTLDHAGRMQLLANSADGKQLKVLNEASMEAGQYTYEWSTTDLAPGMYYVTLLLDGQPMVKKGVRVKE